MKSSCAFTKVKISLFVIISIAFFNACTMENSISKKDFYNKRLVKKSENRTFAFKNRHIKYAEITAIAINHEQEQVFSKDASSVVVGTFENQAINRPQVILSNNSTEDKLTRKPSLSKEINSLFQKTTDVKTFKKEYKAIKEQRIKKFVNKQKTDDPLPTTQKQGGNGLSIASFVLSIVGLVIFGLVCGLLAIIFGGIALSKGKGLRGLAIAGLVIGIIDVAFVLIYMASMA